MYSCVWICEWVVCLSYRASQAQVRGVCAVIPCSIYLIPLASKHRSNTYLFLCVQVPGFQTLVLMLTLQVLLSTQSPPQFPKIANELTFSTSLWSMLETGISLLDLHSACKLPLSIYANVKNHGANLNPKGLPPLFVSMRDAQRPLPCFLLSLKCCTPTL